MSGDDFDLEGLARYLELDALRVRRMAERGELPGRKVSGEWRFSRPEISLWIQDRLMEADDEERDRLNRVLERDTTVTEARRLSIASLLPLEAIALPLQARTRASVIREMVDLAMQTGFLWDPDQMVEAVREREDMCPTALEGGVALLHPRRPQSKILGAPFVAFGRTDTGIPFGDPDGGLTDLFFLVLSIDDRGHLRCLALLGRLLRLPDLLEELRRAPDATAVRDVLVQAGHDSHP